MKFDDKVTNWVMSNRIWPKSKPYFSQRIPVYSLSHCVSPLEWMLCILCLTAWVHSSESCVFSASLRGSTRVNPVYSSLTAWVHSSESCVFLSHCVGPLEWILCILCLTAWVHSSESCVFLSRCVGPLEWILCILCLTAWVLSSESCVFSVSLRGSTRVKLLKVFLSTR